MPFTIIDAAGPIISAKISGQLGKSEVTEIQTFARAAIQRHGKISALFIFDNFQGWQREGNWGDISFMIEQDQNIAKIAVVGEDKWRDMTVAFLAKGFRQAAVEYFLPNELAKARNWLA